MLRYKAPETVCGIVSQIGRDGETSRTMTLAELRNTKSGYVYDGLYRKQSDKGNPGSHGNAEGISL